MRDPAEFYSYKMTILMAYVRLTRGYRALKQRTYVSEETAALDIFKSKIIQKFSLPEEISNLMFILSV